MTSQQHENQKKGMTRQAIAQRALNEKGLCRRCGKLPVALKPNGKNLGHCEACRCTVNTLSRNSKSYFRKVARPGTGSGRKKTVPDGFTAQHGLLHIDGVTLTHEAAHKTATDYKFKSAERLVQYLERRAAAAAMLRASKESLPQPEVFFTDAA